MVKFFVVVEMGEHHPPFPGCVMVARQTLDLLVGVQILPGEEIVNPYVARK